MMQQPLLLRGVCLPDSVDEIDVLCDGPTIAAIGSSLESERAFAMDLHGKLVLPAFVDVHSHADGRAWEPGISQPKVKQGIALEVVGNCGLGPAPSSEDSGWRSLITGVCGGVPDGWSFQRFGDYQEQLDSANTDVWPRVASLAPYGSIRASVAGLDRTLEVEQVRAVRDRVDDALADGAVGVSLGLVYPPNDASSFDELLETLQPLAAARLPLATHIRSQADRWTEAIDEVLALAMELGVRLLISHLCVGGKRNQWKLPWVLARLREARRQGIDVWFDQHPYAAGSTSLTQLLPSRCLAAGTEGIRVVVPEAELRELLEHPSSDAGWENYLQMIGASSVMIAGAPSWPEIAGRTIAELADEWQTSLSETLLRLLEGTRGNAAIILTELYDQDAINTIAREPFGCFSTDSVHSAHPHPRLFGTYPYAYRTFCGGGLLSETEFSERSSRRPAQILGLRRACVVRPGAEADLVVVDRQTFGHEADYRWPWHPVTGLAAVVLRGEIFALDREDQIQRPVARE